MRSLIEWMPNEGWLTAALLVALGTGCAEVRSQGDGSLTPIGSDAGGAIHDGAAVGTAGDLGLPAVGFTPTELGGYKLGDPLATDASTGPGSGQKICNTITGVARDFKGALAAAGGTLEPGGHPDFEVFEGRGPTRGLVAPALGADRKPVYASQCQTGTPVSAACPFGAMTTTKANFDQWYRSLDGVNKPYLVYFQLAPGAGGVSTFESQHFFPLDGAGWGNNGTDMGVPHNFSFTTEIHTTFTYVGGEHFTFTGDDDVWIFINAKLAVDLGGLHFPEQGTVDLDASATTLGITKGQVYPLELFHAERHSIGSTFRIDLNFTFESCGFVVP
jgi:fibro-slime domain-containing protein